MTAQPIDHTTVPAGTILEGRWTLGEKLGAGGFATVYAGQHLKLEKHVAIKVLEAQAPPGTFEIFQERFLREAKLSAKLEHPNVVQILDFGFIQHQGAPKPFIVMERLRGLDLEEELIQNGPLDPERAKTLFDGALAALAESHQKGIVHRDLKPSNLFITNPNTEQERLVVLDFGIARVFDDPSSKLTATNHYTGTPAYLAPEYIESQQSTPAVDVYQMGLIVAEALTGKLVVEASSPLAYLMAHCNGQQKIPDYLIGTPLGNVLERAVQVDPAKRPADASELRRELIDVDWTLSDTHALANAPTEAHVAVTPTMDLPHTLHQNTSEHIQPLMAAPAPPTQQTSRARPAALIALVCVLVAGVGAGAFILGSKTPPKASTTQNPTAKVEHKALSNSNAAINDSHNDGTSKSNPAVAPKAATPPSETTAKTPADTAQTKTTKGKPTKRKRPKTKAASFRSAKTEPKRRGGTTNLIASSSKPPGPAVQPNIKDPMMLLKPTAMDKKIGQLSRRFKDIAYGPANHYSALQYRIKLNGLDDPRQVALSFSNTSSGSSQAAKLLQKLAKRGPKISKLDRAAKALSAQLMKSSKLEKVSYVYRLQKDHPPADLKRLVASWEKQHNSYMRARAAFMQALYDQELSVLAGRMKQAKSINATVAYHMNAAMFHATSAMKVAETEPASSKIQSHYKQALDHATKLKAMDIKSIHPDITNNMKNDIRSIAGSIRGIRGHLIKLKKLQGQKRVLDANKWQRNMSSARYWSYSGFGIMLRRYHTREF